MDKEKVLALLRNQGELKAANMERIAIFVEGQQQQITELQRLLRIALGYTPLTVTHSIQKSLAACGDECDHVWLHDIRQLTMKENRCTLCGEPKK